MHLHVIHCSLQWWRPLYYRIRQPSPALQPRDCPSLFQSTIHVMKLAHHQTSNYYIDYTSHPHDQPHTKLQQKRIPLLCLGLECRPHGHWLWARCKLQVLDLRIEKLVKCLHHANRQKDSGSHSHRSHLYSKPRFLALAGDDASATQRPKASPAQHLTMSRIQDAKVRLAAR